MSAPADRYRRLAARFSDVVNAVPNGAWTATSPCDGWSARDVLHHVVTTELDFLGRMPFAPEEKIATDDPGVAWPIVRDLVQTALDAPATAQHVFDGYFGPTTFEALLDHFYNTDLVVHAWDLARATGQSEFEEIDAGEMVRIRSDFGADFAETMRMPGIFGPALPVAAGASEQDRFLAWLGREPNQSSPK